jgi:hypothetical protein
VGARDFVQVACLRYGLFGRFDDRVFVHLEYPGARVPASLHLRLSIKQIQSQAIAKSSSVAGRAFCHESGLIESVPMQVPSTPKLLSVWAQLAAQILWECFSLQRLLPYLEMAAKLLELLEGFLAVFSKCDLNSLNNQADFDSAIRRFDPSRPSQPVRQPKIDYTIIAESLQNRGFLALLARSPDSELPQP